MTSPANDTAGRPARSRKRAPSPPTETPSTVEDQPATEVAPDDAMTSTEPAVEARPARPPRDRAEVLLDQAGQQVGQFITDLGHRFRVVSARAQEEAEDIWAEAKSLRNKERP